MGRMRVELQNAKLRCDRAHLWMTNNKEKMLTKKYSGTHVNIYVNDMIPFFKATLHMECAS